MRLSTWLPSRSWCSFSVSSQPPLTILFSLSSAQLLVSPFHFLSPLGSFPHCQSSPSPLDEKVTPLAQAVADLIGWSTGLGYRSAVGCARFQFDPQYHTHTQKKVVKGGATCNLAEYECEVCLPSFTGSSSTVCFLHRAFQTHPPMVKISSSLGSPSSLRSPFLYLLCTPQL